MKALSPLVTEVYENQRYYPPFGWNIAPDYPNFTSAQDGQAIKFEPPLESPETQSEWEINYNPLTDDYEGWQYGQFFQNLTEQREGGRQSKRGSDLVRHRKWVKKGIFANLDSQKSTAREVSFRDLTQSKTVNPKGANGQCIQEIRDIKKVRESQMALKQFKEYSLMKGYDHFQDILRDLLRRNNLWDVLTLDPLAWIFVNQKHAEIIGKYKKQARDRIVNSLMDQEHSNQRRMSLKESDILKIHYAKMKSDGQDKRYKSDQASEVISCLGNKKDLLEMVIQAAKFARASYGYVQLAGYMSNFGTFAQMQLGRTNFDPVGQASVDANNKAILKLTGIHQKDLLMAEWHNSTFRPCHFVAIDRYQELIVISIRGSLQMGDIYTDLAAKPMEFNLNQTHGYVHQGLLSAATYIHFNTNKALETAAELYPNYQVLVTGHSLGAGVASILSLLLKQRNGAPQQLQENGIFSINFGSPPTMSTTLCQECQDSIVSVIHRSDVVPSLSYLSFERLLKEVSEQAFGNRAVQGLNSFVSRVQDIVNNQNPFKNDGFAQIQNNFAKQLGLGKVTDTSNVGSNSQAFEQGLKNYPGNVKEQKEAKRALSMLDNFYGKNSESNNSSNQSSPQQSPRKGPPSPSKKGQSQEKQEHQSAFLKQAQVSSQDVNKQKSQDQGQNQEQKIAGKGGLADMLSGKMNMFNSFKKKQANQDTIYRNSLEPSLKEKIDMATDSQNMIDANQVNGSIKSTKNQSIDKNKEVVQQIQDILEDKEQQKQYSVYDSDLYQNIKQKSQESINSTQEQNKVSSKIMQNINQQVQSEKLDLGNQQPESNQQIQNNNEKQNSKDNYESKEQYQDDLNKLLEKTKKNTKKVQDEQQFWKHYKNDLEQQKTDNNKQYDQLQNSSLNGDNKNKQLHDQQSQQALLQQHEKEQEAWQKLNSQKVQSTLRKDQSDNNSQQQSGMDSQNLQKDSSQTKIPTQFSSKLLDSEKSIKNRADIELLYKDLNKDKGPRDLFQNLQPKKQSLDKQDLEHIQGQTLGSNIQNVLKDQNKDDQFYRQKTLDRSLQFLHEEVDHINLEQDLKIAGRAFWIMYEGVLDSWMDDKQKNDNDKQKQEKDINALMAGSQNKQQKDVEKQTKQNQMQVKSVQQQQKDQGFDMQTQQQKLVSEVDIKSQNNPSQKNALNEQIKQKRNETDQSEINKEQSQDKQLITQKSQDIIAQAKHMDEQKFLEEINRQDVNQQIIIQQQLKTLNSNPNQLLPPAARAYLQNLDKLKDNLETIDSPKKITAEQHLLQKQRYQKEVAGFYSQASQQAMQDQQKLSEIQEQVQHSLSEQNPQKNQLLSIVQQAQEQVTKQFGIQAPKKKEQQWIGLIECKGGMFSDQILLHMDMIEDHFPDRYV